MSVRFWGPEQVVNVITAGDQRSPSITTLTNGDLVVVWEDMSAGAGEIRARIYAPDGTPRGLEMIVAATGLAETNPVVVALADGGFHVTYEEAGNLKTLTFNADGTSDGAANNASNSASAAAVGGFVGEAMLQAYVHDNDVWVTTFDSNGVALAVTRANTTGLGASPQSEPDVAILTDGAHKGYAITVWQDAAGNICGRFIDPQGAAVSANEFQLDQSGFTAGTPKAAALKSGLVITWTEYGGVDQAPDVFARMLDANGVPLGDAFQVNAVTSGYQALGDVVALPDGGFMAIWVDVDGLKGQRFDATGERLGLEFQASTGAAVDQVRSVSATLMVDGRVAVTWEGSDDDGQTAGVRMQILDPRDGDVNGSGASEALYGSAYDDQIVANGGHDQVSAGGGIDQVFGGSGSDSLKGEAGDDGLFGQSGDDILTGGLGMDRLDGGEGDMDFAVYAEKTRSIVVTLNRAGEAVVRVGGVDEDIVLNVENIVGGKAGDTLTGDAGDNGLTGNEGNDLLKGGAGADDIIGGSGVDTVDYRDKTKAVTLTLNGVNEAVATVDGVAEDRVFTVENVFGGSAGDKLTGDGAANTLNGGGGADLLKGAGGKDLLIGGLGSDTADYSEKTDAVSLTLKGGSNAAVKVGGVAEDTIRSIENVYGGAGADTLTGDGLANLFRGGGGIDVIDGKGGADIIDFSDHTGAVVLTLNGATQATAFVDGAASDKVKNVEGIIGGSGADTLTGDGFNNVLRGGDGADRLQGRGGADTLTGGLGGDVFEFDFLVHSTPGAAGRDTITDFSGAGLQGDKIDLSGIDAISGGANNAFTFGEMVAGTPGRLQVSAMPTDGGFQLFKPWLVEGDTTGDGVADFAIVVMSGLAPVEGDFVL